MKSSDVGYSSTGGSPESNGSSNGFEASGNKATMTAARPMDEKIRLARLKGYEGDPCSECGQLTLIRSGACCKCDTCGATTGCG